MIGNSSANDLGNKLAALSEAAAAASQREFSAFDKLEEINTQRVMKAFYDARVSEVHLQSTNGYGYDDKGRDTLDSIYASLFGAESALVRAQIVSGTHALALMLFAVGKPGMTILSVCGKPYDTLEETLGIRGEAVGTLKYYGVCFEQIDLLDGGIIDVEAMKRRIAKGDVCAIHMQRSRGYSLRPAVMLSEIERACREAKNVCPEIIAAVDNCYGEFLDVMEPTSCGADVCAGSLIKNPGGGIAETGGYVVGRKDIVEAASFRLTAPGIGGECGPTLGQNRFMYRGLFMAPHTVCQALKAAVYCANLFSLAGFEVFPAPGSARGDIIQTVVLKSRAAMLAFCEGIQEGAPVDSFVHPEPWAMPGYSDDIIMAAGAFVQGSSIELSADGPVKPPYAAYMQGGLTFMSAKYGIDKAMEKLIGRDIVSL